MLPWTSGSQWSISGQRSAPAVPSPLSWQRALRLSLEKRPLVTINHGPSDNHKYHWRRVAKSNLPAIKELAALDPHGYSQDPCKKGTVSGKKFREEIL
jgi:hypothetical protein